MQRGLAVALKASWRVVACVLVGACGVDEPQRPCSLPSFDEAGLFGGGFVAAPGDIVTTRWRASCVEGRSLRATLTGPTGEQQPIRASTLTAPFQNVVEATFELPETQRGLHLLEAWLEPGDVHATVEIIVPIDRTTAHVFEETVPVWPDQFEAYAARTAAGLLVYGARHSRGGLVVPTPRQFPADPSLIIAVKNTVWVRSTEFSPYSTTISRWTDDGMTLVLDGQVSVPHRCIASFVDENRLLCTGDGFRFDFFWNGRAVEANQSPRTEPFSEEYRVGDRRFLRGREEGGRIRGNAVCEEHRVTRALSCREDLNFLGLSAMGPLIREFTTGRLGVWGREGRSWWYSSGGLSAEKLTSFGMVEDQGVALSRSLIVADLPLDHRALVMTANGRGLQFERYELGPPLGAGVRPHRIIAVLHDWVVVRRSHDRERVFFIARR